MIASAGDIVIVTYDGNSGFGTWKIYVEGTLLWGSNSIGFFMQSTTSPDAVRLGDISHIGPNQTGYPTSYDELSGWYCRLDKIFVANGTAFDQSQVTEITADKADLTGSDNYGDMNVYATIGSGGVTSVKGGCTYTRGDIAIDNGGTFSSNNNNARFL